MKVQLLECFIKSNLRRPSMFELETIYKKLTSSAELSLQTLQTTIRQLIKVAYRMTYGNADNCVVLIDDSSIEIFETKTVVEEEYSERLEIELSAAILVNPVCKIGDKLNIHFDSSLLSNLFILKATTELYRKTSEDEKKFIIQFIQAQLEGVNLYEKTPSKVQPSSGRWESLYEDYKPYHRKGPITPTEKEMKRIYGAGFYDFGPNPFPFSSFNSEDDYGAESWS